MREKKEQVDGQNGRQQWHITSQDPIEYSLGLLRDLWTIGSLPVYTCVLHVSINHYIVTMATKRTVLKSCIQYVGPTRYDGGEKGRQSVYGSNSRTGQKENTIRMGGCAKKGKIDER